MPGSSSSSSSVLRQLVTALTRTSSNQHSSTLLRALDAHPVLKSALVRLLPPGSPMSFVATVLKALVAAVLLVNIRSWPFAWHIRIFRFAWLMQLEHKLLTWRSALYYSKRGQAKLEHDWFERKAPIGRHPTETVVKYTSRAVFDDIDFLGHLSNSSYSKTCDVARFKTAITNFPFFFRVGGWIPLAASHFTFHREIPAFAPYEVRTTTQAWDEKWIYVVCKFVGPPKKGKGKGKKVEDVKKEEKVEKKVQASTAEDVISLASSISPTPAEPATPASDAENSNTIATLDGVSAGLSGDGAGTASGSPTSGTRTPPLPIPTEPDGALVYTTGVFRMCFKVGRITIPPALVFAINGFTTLPASSTSPHFPAYSPKITKKYTKTGESLPDEVEPFSKTNPPPHWEEVLKLVSPGHGGDVRAFRKFLQGGWRVL